VNRVSSNFFVLGKFRHIGSLLKKAGQKLANLAFEGGVSSNFFLKRQNQWQTGPKQKGALKAPTKKQ
jgi:hypothetical protein